MSDTRGTTAIEYAIIAGFLSVFILTAVDLLGTNVKNEFFDKLAAVIVQ